MKPLPSVSRRSLFVVVVVLAACSGSGAGAPEPAAIGQGSGDFDVVGTEPVIGSTIHLNDAIAVDFTQPVDLDSASLRTMDFQVLDPTGQPLAELVTGRFSIATRPGDDAPGRRLLFVPRYPTDGDYDDGGFRSGRRYLVRLVGGFGDDVVLRDRRGRPLERPHTFSFSTREGSTPAQLFRNPRPSGPRRSGFEVGPGEDLERVRLGLFGTPPLEVRLHFDQALNPDRANLPLDFATDPLLRDPATRGRVYLEYDDPETGANTWLPADVELERNDLTGATLILRPIGVLPNAAEIRVIVEATVEDIAGEANLGDPSYDRVFATFHTEASPDQRWNGIVEDFRSSDGIDFGATFPEAQAEYGPGFLRAGFAFEGAQTDLSYRPTSAEVVLNTAFTQVVPESGLPFTVNGGVFHWKNVTIPAGVTVVGQGPNPMVWLCSGTFTVAGTLTVRGGHGARVDTLISANVAKAGGVAGPGGGNGGDGTPLATARDARGATGRGPLQAAGKGGRGGRLSCVAGCYTDPDEYGGSGGGSGGGGGTLATQGDPHWRGAVPGGAPIPNTPPSINTRFQQRLGYGGAGCSGESGTRTGNGVLAGGEPGDLVFTDSRADNDFWGSGLDLRRNLRIAGELSVPMGGGGGGGGGDRSPSNDCSETGGPFAASPSGDNSGGGGGGGGGVLIVKALGEIRIEATGNVNANGGNGGGGEQVGSCGHAGGGGGGAGGMVVLMSATRITIVAHGSTATNRFVYGAPPGGANDAYPYLGNDYSFAIAADGGVCTTGAFRPPFVPAKYPFQAGATMVDGTYYDSNPLGGLGGMGIVQLMVPPGENLDDGTNTRLDDRIDLLDPSTGAKLTGRRKEQLLAWRGFPVGGGMFVDDAGAAVAIGSLEGDIRPAPILLPVPFGARSRARSKWLDTGSSQRRELTANDGLPRALDTSTGALAGPRFEFAGLDLANAIPGYAAYARNDAGELQLVPPVVMPPTAIEALTADANHLGRPAYRLRLQSGDLAPERYVQYQAELLGTTGDVLAGYRIVSHGARELLLEAGPDLLPTTATHARVVAKFFDLRTDGAAGLGRFRTSFPIGGAAPIAIPIANVRIGFALHHDPRSAVGRFPTDEQQFLHDFASPAFAAWLTNSDPLVNPKPGVMPRYLQWDVVFDMAFEPDASPARALQPDTPRQELRFLRVPFRF